MVSCIDLPRLPVIDLALFDLGDPWRDQVAAQIDAASSEFGFFYLVGHGIDVGVVEPLMAAGRRFITTEDAVKRRVQPGRGGLGRDGYFAPLEERTAGRPDAKHGLVVEAHLTSDDERVTAGSAAPGQTFLPDFPGFREPVLDYMRSLTGLSHKLMAMVARGLRLEDSYFVDRCTGSPATSFRILNYPQAENVPATKENSASGARADPGLLTLLKQDTSGGLELKYGDRWIDVPAISYSFVCIVGDALARLTNGRYVAAAHRVSNSAEAHRLSMLFCFDPTLNAMLEPIAAVGPAVSRPTLDDIASSGLLEPGRRYIA
jgi:polar amino acid transport system ATP-binding protein